MLPAFELRGFRHQGLRASVLQASGLYCLRAALEDSWLFISQVAPGTLALLHLPEKPASRAWGFRV